MTSGAMEMKKLLPYDEWEHHVPKSVGRIRANHTTASCTGGSDSLLVERKADGSSSAYCFRCGGSGWRSADPYYVPLAERRTSDSRRIGVAATAAPDDATGEWGAFPKEVKAWLLDAHFTPVIIKDNGLVWSDKTSSLYIPVRQYTDGGYTHHGWVVRQFNPKGYYTRTDDIEGFYGYYKAKDVIDNSTVVLVEDTLSAIRVAELYDAIALLGVNIKPAVLSHILRSGYKRAVIFLDGDNTTVRLQARKIAKRLSWLDTKLIETGTDPKHYTKEELDTLLTW